MAGNCVIQKRLKGRDILSRCKILESTHADMTAGGSANHRAGQGAGFAQDAFSGGGCRKGAGGGDTERMHGF